MEMEKMTVDGVKIEYEKGLASDEVEGIVRTEIIAWQEKGKKLAKVELNIYRKNSVEIKSTEAAQVGQIKRVRRITGYLSNVENFNDAKKAECRDRLVHIEN